MLLAGIGLSLAAIISLAVSAFWSPTYAQSLAAVTATNIVFGRTAAISLGYAMGLDGSAVVLVNLLVEAILVLVFYPLFVFSWWQLFEFKRLRRYMTALRNAAERHRETIRRYGIIGLFLFVWSPLWMTGPVVGCAIGFLLGLQIRVTLSVVLGGTCVAMIGWAIIMKELSARAAQLSAIGPLVLFAIVVLLFGAGYLIRIRGRNRPEK
ncbi:small multi-drug export protein [Thiococcus pfennigii]|uniref:small multi-drug export protein n=1 Tax=Thiococcus pfennigii TaxID=1057 RepID=UPI00190849A6|nr:hypothetical protein [Thiococcus pfennigii]